MGLDPKKGLATIFGALVTLRLFGGHVLDTVLMDHVKDLSVFINEQRNSGNERVRKEAEQTHQVTGKKG